MRTFLFFVVPMLLCLATACNEKTKSERLTSNFKKYIPEIETEKLKFNTGTDCNKPDSVRANCASINLEFPIIKRSRQSSLIKLVNSWSLSFVCSLLSDASMQTQTPDALDNAVKSFIKAHESFKGSLLYGAFYAKSSYKVLFNDGKYLTLQLHGESFQGGAHAAIYTKIATFDCSTGNKITFNDIIRDEKSFENLLKKEIQHNRKDAFKNGFKFDDIFSFKLPDNFGIVENGLIIHYDHYEIMPYAYGSTTFTILNKNWIKYAKTN